MFGLYKSTTHSVKGLGLFIKDIILRRRRDRTNVHSRQSPDLFIQRIWCDLTTKED